MTSANDDDPFNSNIYSGSINNNYSEDNESMEELVFDSFGADDSQESASLNGVAMAPPPLVKQSFPDAKKLFNGTEEMNTVR